MADSPIPFSTLERLPDPLLSFKWVCETLPNFANIRSEYVEAVSLPFPSIQQKEGVFGAGTYTFYPGYVNISAFDVTFYEDRYVNALKFLEAWFSRIWNKEDGTFYLAGNYKRSMVFALYDQNNKKVARLTMLNCWPTARGNLDLDYTSNDRRKIQQNFSTDGQKLEFL